MADYLVCLTTVQCIASAKVTPVSSTSKLSSKHIAWQAFWRWVSQTNNQGG